MAPDWLVKLDWKLDYDATTMDQQTADRVGEAVERFTMTKTKTELYLEGAIDRRILIAPVATTRDIIEDLQLKSRGYWEELEHAEINGCVPYCGPFIKMSETPIKNRKRAPLISENNDEIYINELGISREKLNFLKNEAVI